MKIPVLFIAALFPLFAACKETPEKTVVSMASENIKLSSHPKASEVASRIRPALEKDLLEKNLYLGDPIFIRAFKEEKQLEVFVKNRSTAKYDLFRSYKIAADSGIIGPKLAEGDGQVPEGFYEVPLSAMNPNSNYHLSFNIGYPNAYDRSLKRTGSFIMIHGKQVSIGCLAMTDEKIEEIFTLADAALRNGQAAFPVHIFPFRMTENRLEKTTGQPWFEFWQNLKEGYERFETTQIPPDVSVKNKRYVFASAENSGR